MITKWTISLEYYKFKLNSSQSAIITKTKQAKF